METVVPSLESLESPENLLIVALYWSGKWKEEREEESVKGAEAEWRGSAVVGAQKHQTNLGVLL